MKFVVTSFSGMAPRLADNLLRDDQASFVANLKATGGALRGFRSNQKIASLTPPATYRRAVKLYAPGTDDFVWFKSTDVTAKVLQSPLANDAFGRVYFTDSGFSAVQKTTLADIAAGNPASNLGVARPTTAPGLAATGGVSATADVRAYIYVYITAQGEVGPPSPPTLVTGKVDDTWTITLPGAVPSYVTAMDIYRTAAGSSTSGKYYKIARRLISDPTTYVDTMAADQVPLQPSLSSENNDPPIAGLRGLVQHSSGAFAAYKGRAVYFSVPYLPHAWPSAYKYELPFEIVGIAAVANSVIALTKGFPVALTGTTPDTVSLINMADAQPCLSERSICVFNNTVLYASPDGLASIGADGADRVTNALLTSEEWVRYSPSTILAGIYGSYYIAFYEPTQGVAIGLPPYEVVSFVPLDRYSNVTGVDTDARTGALYVLQSDTVYNFDQLYDVLFPTTWRSKEWITPQPVNMGAFQIIFKAIQDAGQLDALLALMRGYNEARLAAGPLDVMDEYTLVGEMPLTAPPAVPEGLFLPPIQPAGGEPLYDLDYYARGASMRFTLIVDGEVRYTKLISDEKVHKLPSGFKGTRFYFELSGSAYVQRVVVAETAKECADA